MTLTQEMVLNSLRHIQDPDLGADLVTLGMVRDVAITPAAGGDGFEVSLRIVLTTPACPVKAVFEKDARESVKALPGVRNVTVKMDSEVKAKRAGNGPGGATAGAIPGVQHIIAVSSGKGGVGKSTVAVNLATALAMEGARVGLMDADVYGPNVPTMMGVTSEPKIHNDPVRGEIFLPPTSHNVKVMSMGFLIQGDQPLVWRGPMLHSVVNQFCHKVEWGQLDYLVVDMPPGTGDVQLSLAQLVPVTGAVLVTTPQEVSMQDVRKAYHMFEKVRVPIMGFVENMSWFECDHGKRYNIFGSEGGKTLAKKFNIDLLAQIPIVPSVREGGDEGRPIVMRDPQSPIAQAFREMARRVAQKTSILAAETAVSGSAGGISIGKF